MDTSPLGHINLESELRYILGQDLGRQTDLCKIMTSYGSDKARPFHNYTVVYDWLFSRFRREPLTIFELGLGTNKPGAPSTMGPGGRPGASLRGWRDYFAAGSVFGADIDHDILFKEDRIQTFWTDQRDALAIRRMWEEVGDRQFDIMVDDGLHEAPANVCFFIESFAKLKPGGIYIIEDVRSDGIELLTCLVRTISCASRYASLELLFHSRNDQDNRIAVFQKS